MEDKELLRLLRKDPDRGTAAALDLYGGVVKTVVWRVLYNFPRDAEECISDAFLKLWKNRKRLDGAPVRAWLIVTARNTAVDRLRKLLKDNSISLTEEMAEMLAAPEEGEAEEILELLSPADREIFVRKYYFLESTAQIAAALGRTESDINSRLSRGRKSLRKQLIQEGECSYDH